MLRAEIYFGYLKTFLYLLCDICVPLGNGHDTVQIFWYNINTYIVQYDMIKKGCKILWKPLYLMNFRIF
jgi:hypothetical protein